MGPAAQFIPYVPQSYFRPGFGFSSYASVRVLRRFSLRLDVGGGRFSYNPGELGATRFSGALPVLFTPALGPLTVRLGAGPALSRLTFDRVHATGADLELGVQGIAGVSLAFAEGAAVFVEARSDAMTIPTVPALLFYPSLMCGLAGALSW